jgi:hypothetical protein
MPPEQLLLSRPDMRITQADLLVSEGVSVGFYRMDQLCHYDQNPNAPLC